jgi:hypothetical protein
VRSSRICRIPDAGSWHDPGVARREPGGAGGLLTVWWALPLIVVLAGYVRFRARKGDRPVSEFFWPFGDSGPATLVGFVLALVVVAFLAALLSSRVRRRVPPEEMERRAEELAREGLERENERKLRAGEDPDVDGRARPTDA